VEGRLSTVLASFTGIMGSGAFRLAGVGKMLTGGLLGAGGVSTGLVSLTGTTGGRVTPGTDEVTFS